MLPSLYNDWVAKNKITACFSFRSVTLIKKKKVLKKSCFVFQSHTILLVQPTKRPEGRTYADYESVNECMEGGCNHCSLKLLLKSWF